MALRASTSVPASPHQRPSNRVARGLLLPPGRTTDSPNIAGWGPSDSSQTQAGLQEEAAMLRQRCSALTSEVFHLRRQLEDMEQRQMQRNQRHQDPEQAAQAAAELEAAIRRAAAAEMALGTVQKAHTEAVERSSQMAVEHQRALLTMHDEVAYKEGVRWQERLNAAQAETRTARDKIAQLETELATMASRLRSNWAPQAADFAALERKIDGMAAEQAARDAQWRVVLSETRELYAVQAQVAEKKALALVAAKQQELELLKGQVDELIVQFATAQAADGSELPMSSMAGQVVLVVNVASKCGFTNQYKELQALYDKYKEQGLSIIGAPCNQFGGQEPGSEAEIVSFCQRNYGVGFPILAKLEVNGENTHPLYQWLKGSKKMMGLKTDISWNFEKFLVDRKGEVVQRFSSMAGASSIEPEVVKLLAQQA
ncbi:hypothetical protein QJQ45_023764 [Haematococcus lacustris]|nr:hypothetical protein QJQ45_023764 [Haematococcus lacustris]